MEQTSNILASPLTLKFHNWQKITDNPVILDWVQNGIQIPFLSKPEPFELDNPKLDKVSFRFLCQEISRLEKRGIVSNWGSVRPHCVSPIKCVPKKGGKFRLIHDLRRVNSHVEENKFTNEGINVVQELVAPGDNIVTVDLKDGFYHVPVHPGSRTFLGFRFLGSYYVWNRLCFGLRCSPYFFGKLIRPVVQFLREQSIKLSAYVDDFILLALASLITSHKDELLNTLDDLGWSVNLEKSNLDPSTSGTHIGYIIDTVGSAAGFPVLKIVGDRVRALKRCIRKCLRFSSISARELARIAGRCIAMRASISPAKLFLRHIYRLLSTRQSWEDVLMLSQGAVNELQWWLEFADLWNQKPIQVRPIQGQMLTDASSIGWGATFEGQEASGQWSLKMSQKSSNTRELYAIWLGILCFLNKMKGKAIQVLTDNTTSLAYINNMGGQEPHLSHLAKLIWDVAYRNDIHLVCRHVRGVNNGEADYLSRIFDRYNWMLHPRLFKFLDSLWGPHTVDRFASCVNTQIARYNSRFHDPFCEGVDALAQQNWAIENNYVNPPFRLLPKVLQVVETQKAVATVIAPFWPAQAWFSKLKALSVTTPIRIPNSPLAIHFMGPTPEPLINRRWKLYAWRISGQTD